MSERKKQGSRRFLDIKGFGEMLNAKNKKKFRETHSSEITVYENAVRFLKGRYPDGKIPSMKALQQEKQSPTIRRDASRTLTITFEIMQTS